jgi:hypothetical protein
MIKLKLGFLAPLVRGLACAMLLTAAARAADPLEGRWALTLPNAAGWLDVNPDGGGYKGSLLWGGGSVVPANTVTVANGTLTMTHVRDLPAATKAGKGGKKGKAAAAQPTQVTDTLTARVQGDAMTGTRKLARANGTFDEVAFTGKRIPALPPKPDLKKVKFGAPVTLFNGRDLTGWKVKEANLKNAWTIENGVLANHPPKAVEGQPHERTANLRTEQEFEDFNLKVEVSVPAGSNSGVYLRGIYEIQVFDSYGKPLDSHNMGALYSRITPSVAAEKPPGEWQTLDITLVNRHLTVLLNGTKIIDNQPVLGCTGGAMWSDEFRPGPIYLQGDHGAVSYRNLVLRPVVK